MEEIYKKILDKAIPHYKKGRKGDIEHIKWLLKTVPNFIDKNEIDLDILIPVVILHDVGYSKVEKGLNPYNLDIRKLHSVEGAKIAEQILIKLNYPKEKIAEIKRLVLKHDNWAFGDSFANEPILLIFQNFDFTWMASKKGFEIVRKIMNKSQKEFYEQIEKFQENNIKRGTYWYNKKIGEFYLKLMKERKKEFS